MPFLQMVTNVNGSLFLKMIKIIYSVIKRIISCDELLTVSFFSEKKAIPDWNSLFKIIRNYLFFLIIFS